MNSILDRPKKLWHDFHRHQNRAVVWGAKFAVLLLGFVIFYVPAHNQYVNFSKTLAQRREEISAIKKSGVNQLQPQELASAEKSIEDFETRFVDISQAASVLKLVSDEASKNNFSISNINSENAVPVMDESGREIERNGKKIKGIPVHVQFEAKYRDIAVFLRSLLETSNRLWVLDSLLVQKKEPHSDDLKCDMTLTFFAY